MASRQKKRTPRNIYTEKRAEQEFRNFIQRSRSQNLPILEQLLTQTTNDDRPTAPKRQRLTLPAGPAQEVCQKFLVCWAILISFPAGLELVRHKLYGSIPTRLHFRCY
jgi:hypothetical protein